MTCLISQLTPSFRARPPRNEICQEDVWSAGPLCLPATAQPHRLRPKADLPAQLVTILEPARGLQHLRKGRGMQGTGQPLGWNGVTPPFLGWGQQQVPTHRVQLPLEYDEGHETDNDKYGAEAQVGKEVAREITWVQ